MDTKTNKAESDTPRILLHQRPERLLEALESEVLAGFDAIRAYRTYRGNDPDYHRRAKFELGLMGNYVRLRATLANEESNRLIAIRMAGGGELPPAAERKALPQGKRR
jgi:hypothetical protein